MRRGTTPTHSFELPFDIPTEAKVRVVYAQGEKYKETVLVEREKKSLVISGNKIQLQLTQEETLRFDCTPYYRNGKYEPYPVVIQIGVENQGNAMWSDEIYTTVERCLKKNGEI
jgi:hypothetical protein